MSAVRERGARSGKVSRARGRGLALGLFDRRLVLGFVKTASRPLSRVARLRLASLGLCLRARRVGPCPDERVREVEMLRVHEVAIGLVRDVMVVVREIERVDPDLARPVRRAVMSTPLNIGEVAPGKAWKEEA